MSSLVCSHELTCVSGYDAITLWARIRCMLGEHKRHHNGWSFFATAYFNETEYGESRGAVV